MLILGLWRARLATFATLLLISSSGCVVYTNQASPPQQAVSEKDEPKAKPKAKKKPKPESKPENKPDKPKAKPKKKPEPRPDKPKAENKPEPKADEQALPEPQPSAAIDAAADAARAAAEAAKLPAGVTQIVVPVRVDFDTALAKIDALIEQTKKQGWTLVSKPGSSPLVEVKYTLWRDALRASFDDKTLKVTVPVHYAADVRAQIKNPLTGNFMWVTHGESWGTKQEPQNIAARFHAQLSLQDDLRVKAKMELGELDHGTAPSGNVCIRAIAKLCVSKESLAPMVRKHMDKYLKPKLQRALDKAGAQIEASMALQTHAQSLWDALQKPLSVQALAQTSCPTDLGNACKTPAWLVLQPSALGFAQPRMDGKDLRVDLAITGKLAVELGDKPAVKPLPLPKLQAITQPAGFSVSAALRLPFELLGAELSKSLKGKDFGDKKAPQLTIKSVKVIDESNVSKYPHRISLVVAVSGALEAELTLTGDLEYDEKDQELSVKHFDYNVQSEALAVKQLASFNHDAFRAQIAKKAHWKLGNKTAALSSAVAGALSGALRDQLKISGELSQLQLKSWKVQTDAVTAEIVLAGALEVAFTPK